jgi:formyltetrahydrofolate synthetase
MANVRRHLANVKQFGVPCVVAVNRRPGDTNEEVELVKRLATEAGAYRAEANEGFAKGGIGAADLASAVVEACEQPNSFHPLYEDDWTIQDKIEAIARRVYGAADVYFYPEAEKKIGQYSADGLEQFPVCMAKTHLSLSHEPTWLNRPRGYRLPVRGVVPAAGAGFVVVLCGEMQRMPGLGRTPNFTEVDIDAEGRTVGLF